MSKTIAPLLSFDAAGQIGKSMVFAKWRGISYARRYVIPANPRTTAQQANRNAFATLREMWKLAPAGLRAPWNAFATGRQFTGVNAFIGENRLAVGTDVLFTEFLASPGARGGLPAGAFAASPGAASGEIDVDFTAPEIPTDWTLDSYNFVAFEDQIPTDRFTGPFTYGSINTPTETDTITGLKAATSYIVCGWTEWTKPNGQIAYGPSQVDTVTSGA